MVKSPKSLGWLSKSLVRGDNKFVIGESTDFGQCRTIQLEVSTNLMRGGQKCGERSKKLNRCLLLTSITRCVFLLGFCMCLTACLCVFVNLFVCLFFLNFKILLFVHFLVCLFVCFYKYKLRAGGLIMACRSDPPT